MNFAALLLYKTAVQLLPLCTLGAAVSHVLQPFFLWLYMQKGCIIQGRWPERSCVFCCSWQLTSTDWPCAVNIGISRLLNWKKPNSSNLTRIHLYLIRNTDILHIAYTYCEAAIILQHLYKVEDMPLLVKRWCCWCFTCFFQVFFYICKKNFGWS